MYYSTAAIVALCAAQAAAHGVVTKINGANGVQMPGLSVKDGTPRGCSTPFCGAEDDTSIISDFELGTDEASALGRTSNGPVNPETNVNKFMGGSAGGNNTKRQLLGGLLGGDDSGASSFNPFSSDGSNAGQKVSPGTKENLVAKTAGNGAQSGLPTCSDDGNIDMTFHQVNQDGAGVLSADVDSTSGGKDPSAFKKAKVTKNVPGDEFGLSEATTTDFPIKVQMAKGTTCKGQIGNVKNVCVVRVRNNAAAGPFGGSAAFTQSKQARKRAIAYNLKNKRFARGIEIEDEE